MREIYSKIIELCENNRFSVLATMVRQTGSAPRRAGAKILILEDGSYVGTIGGGLLEAQVLEGAGKVFETRSPLRMNFILKGKDVEKMGMLCGGDAEVFLEPVFPGNPDHLHILRRLMEISQRGGSGVLATIVSEDRWRSGQLSKVFLLSDGQSIGVLPGIKEIGDALKEEMTRLLSEKRPDIIASLDDEGEALELFVEPVFSDPVLYVFGGGHVSLQIVPMAARVGFKVVVIDDRPEFAQPGSFPEAAQVHQYPFEGVLERLPVDESSYLVIVTRGHLHDRTVLAQCLKTPARYIGMIGSRRKRNMLYHKLLEEGFTREDLDRVYSPIGIDIRAETPEEIAVSIVAELIKVRASA